MAFHLGQDDGQGVSEINLIPLIDIMLVLMVIFLVTASVVAPTVKVALPSTQARPELAPPRAITLSLDAHGTLFLDQQPLQGAALRNRLQDIARTAPGTPVLLRVDRNTRYEAVAQLMAEISQAGLHQLGFVSDPPATH